ncbi:hypothetical protein [Nocardia nova]|uniref:hypothetical protein n=1 Tax=Nocardia nova TaxID=37330 RepID=UPI0015E3CA3B|nr:hypothetical protein [Nocardia nova]
MGVAQAAAPTVAPAADTTPTEPSTGTGSAALLPSLLQALVTGGAQAPDNPDVKK